MIALLRLAVFGFLILSVLYVGVAMYSRVMRTRKLRKEWEEMGKPGARDDYVAAGLEDYEDSFRRKLISLIYIVPVVVIAIIIYVVNFM